ncbi:hypothetical protein H6P81_003681 [Aristolochia fimbriata]|uniref:Bifunctional inhibitor/plant lipid transfer protein/seed storage helical domain-containing protein n=1 Tax=Aristolochia fimbriata TaxID=158543 RepID=A0AAV7FDH9_ARIFI|nr:hypothetical protein H6P81_003681 [Aristolochia fimbriata]
MASIPQYNCVFLTFIVLVAAGILPSGDQHYVVQADSCDDDFKALIMNCEKFVRIPGPRVPPSPDCCKVVERSNLPCVCSRITKEIGKLISPAKLAFVTKSCNRPIPSGTKCGSITIPLA